MTMASKTVQYFKYIAIAEGVSFLVLLLIAMPLKYMAGMPLMVKYVGWAHGALFVLYIAMVFVVWRKLSWSIFQAGLAVLASVLPAGPFFVDKYLLK